MTTGRDLYLTRYPTGDWNQVPTWLQDTFNRAAHEHDHPRICRNCGYDGDRHTGGFGACEFDAAPSRGETS